MFPLLYHAHHFHYTEDLSFWSGLAQRQGGPILELGCGTGRVLVSLAREGYPVYGLDSDAGMLATLLEYLPPDLTSTCHIFQADMSTFHLARGFPLILLPCNTLSTLSAGERQAMMKCTYRHLQPGGLFATSLPNPAVLAALPERSDPEMEELFPHPLDGEPVQVSSAWERTPDGFIVRWLYDHLLPNGRVDRLDVQAIHTLTSAETYLEELGAAGLTIFSIHGDFDGSPYTPDSPFLLIVAGCEASTPAAGDPSGLCQ